MSVKTLKDELRKSADPEKARTLTRFFKTGKGEYGEGDIFLGVVVPEQRKIAARHDGLSVDEIRGLLDSPVHEERMIALFVLIRQYKKGDDNRKKDLAKLYYDCRHRVNNWDLVDLSAPHIMGHHYLDRDRSPLLRLARSKSLWDRRIAVMATFHFIKSGDFATTFEIADMLLADREDLIHKAAGWMIREIGKRDPAAARAYLKGRYRRMPRTMLRYAIEKYPEEERQRYLKATIA